MVNNSNTPHRPVLSALEAAGVPHLTGCACNRIAVLRPFHVRLTVPRPSVSPSRRVRLHPSSCTHNREASVLGLLFCKAEKTNQRAKNT